MEQKRIRTTVKGIIKKDGLEFKDLFGDGELKPYEDWRIIPSGEGRRLGFQDDG